MLNHDVYTLLHFRRWSESNGHRSKCVYRVYCRIANASERAVSSCASSKDLELRLHALQLLCIFDVFSIESPFAAKFIVILHVDTSMSTEYAYISPHIYVCSVSSKIKELYSEIHGINVLISLTCNYKNPRNGLNVFE